MKKTRSTVLQWAMPMIVAFGVLLSSTPSWSSEEELELPHPAPPVEDPQFPLQMTLGQFVLSGTSCLNWDEAPVILGPYRLFLPFRTWVKRSTGRRLLTGRCDFQLPVHIPKGHRLVLYGLAANQMLHLSPDAQAELHVVLHLGESDRLHLTSQDRAIQVPLTQMNELDSDGEISSKCQQDVVIRGSAEIILQSGSGLANSSVRDLRFDYAIVPCDEL